MSVNQCDGCRARRPIIYSVLKTRMHRMGDRYKYGNYMVCQKYRYVIEEMKQEGA